jgi:hypothetical protein
MLKNVNGRKFSFTFFVKETEKKRNINPYPMQSLSYEVRMGNNEKRKSEKGKMQLRKSEKGRE